MVHEQELAQLRKAQSQSSSVARLAADLLQSPMSNQHLGDSVAAFADAVGAVRGSAEAVLDVHQLVQGAPRRPRLVQIARELADKYAAASTAAYLCIPIADFFDETRRAAFEGRAESQRQLVAMLCKFVTLTQKRLSQADTYANYAVAMFDASPAA